MRRIHWIFAGTLLGAAVMREIEMLGTVLLPVAERLVLPVYLLLAALHVFLLAKLTELSVFLYEKRAGRSGEMDVPPSRFYWAAAAGVAASGLYALLMAALFPPLWETGAGFLLLFLLRVFIAAHLSELVLSRRGASRRAPEPQQ